MFRVFKASSSYFNCKPLLNTRTLRKMSEISQITVRSLENESHMQLSFLYEDPSMKINRRFNLNRSKDEEISIAFARIRSNIQNIYEQKKNKKTKKVKREAAAAAVEASTPPEDQEMPEISIKLQHGDVVLPDNTINMKAWKNGAVLTLGSTLYKVIYNAPVVRSLTLPKSIMAGYPVYPKIELEFTNEIDSDYTWYRSYSKKEKDTDPLDVILENTQYWQKIGSNFYYIPTNKDIGKVLRMVCTPGKDGVKGLSVEVKSVKDVEAAPGQCPFETRHLYTKNLTDQGFFRCLSYNILADLYADSDFTRTTLFPYCPPYALEIDYRKQLFLKEIIGYNADLICLQEVDKKIFISDLNPVLKNAGFCDGIFNLKGGQVAEGLATFYRASKFRLVENEVIILADRLPNDPNFIAIYSAISANEKLEARILKRTTAFQMSLLQSVEDPSNFTLVGNTHLYFHPDADHIRLLQATMVIRYMEERVKTHQANNPTKKYSVLLFGDFNSTPEWGVYQLMTTGRVGKEALDWKSNAEQTVQDLEVFHDLSLDSGCGCPPYTNYTSGFNGCLDYIFYDKRHLEVTEVIPMPTHEQVTQNVAIPNIDFPSDHIAIGCTLKWSGS